MEFDIWQIQHIGSIGVFWQNFPGFRELKVWQIYTVGEEVETGTIIFYLSVKMGEKSLHPVQRLAAFTSCSHSSVSSERLNYNWGKNVK